MSDRFSGKDFLNKRKAFFFGGIIGLLFCILAMVLFSFVLLIFNVDRAFAAPFATISVAIGCFISSRVAAKRIGEKGYVLGIIIGLIVFVCITTISLILGNKLSLNTLFHFIIILLSSLVGGISGVNVRKYKKYI